MKDPEFTLDLQSERLWKGDRPLSVSNKAFQLLKLFTERPEQLLLKEDILDRIWGEISVTEGLVREYVHDLRVLLDDDPKAPRYIETVPRRGYRFLGGVAIRERGETEPDIGGGTAGRPVLVVCPFEDLTGSTRSTRLVHGLTDDLVTDLARVPDLTVVKGGPDNMSPGLGRTGRAADYCLEGGLQVDNGMVRLNVRLSRFDDGQHVWAERYDHRLENLLKVQSDLTARIISTVAGQYGPIAHSERLRLNLRRPSSLEVYELYRLAFDLELTFDRASVLRAQSLIERAIELEPNFARGWLVIGWIAWQLAMENWGGDPEGMASSHV